MKDAELKYCKILGTNINVTDMNKTVAYLEEHLEELRGKYVCVSNVHTTVTAYKDREYRDVQNHAAMALPDGKPLSIVSRSRGCVDARRVPGPDLMVRIFECSEKKGYRHFFYGSTRDTLEKLRKNITDRYPHIQIAGMYAPPFRDLSEREDKEIIRRINETEPDFIWVALGAPKQEKWMYDHRNQLSGVMLGVGAAFDFSAGTVKRAPKWMQELCLEWLFRITQDPKRLIARYFSTNMSFLWNVGRESHRIRRMNRLKKDSLRIAMIGHKRIPGREGGAEVVVYELSSRLVKKNHRVDAYNRWGAHASGREFRRKTGKNYNGIKIITIPTFEKKSLNAIVYSFFASIRVLFGRYDVIHYHAEGPCAMLWIPKLFRKRIVVTIHGLDWQRAKWGGFASAVIKFGEKLASKYADEIIVLSSHTKQYFMDVYGRKTYFIANGISRAEKREPQIIEKQWNLHKDEYILFLARIVPEKGVHYLIKAYKQIKTGKKLVIAGGITPADDYMNELFRIAGGVRNIIFTDFVGGRDMEELFSNAYLFVLPSDVEGMAMGLLEAMSYGNCCLVSDIPENTEVVEDKAFTFRKGSVRDLKEKLEYLVKNPEKVAEYKAAAAEFICGKYDWDRVVDETLEIYRGRAEADGQGAD